MEKVPSDNELKLQIVDLLIDVYGLAEKITTPDQMHTFVESVSKTRKKRVATSCKQK